MTEAADAPNVESGSRVRHAQYGTGVVREVTDSLAMVECDSAVDGKNTVIVKLDELVIDDGSPFVQREAESTITAAPTTPIELPDHLKNGGSNLGNLAAWLPNFDNDGEIAHDSAAPEGEPTTKPSELADAPETPIPVVTTFNDKYYVVSNFGGKCVVCEEDNSLNLKHQSFADFTNRYLHWTARTGVKEVGRGANKTTVPVYENAATYWLKHPSRRQYDRITFAPGEDLGPKVRNLWRGFTFKPVKGDCSLYLNHLRDNICKGDDEKYQWLINWMAWKIQHPGIKCYISIVLRGAEGVGKNICYDGFGDLFGPHSITVTNKEHVAGHFNAHLRACCVLCANEAFFAGDRQHEATLKSLISDDFFMIEAKGYDPIPERNRLGLFIISNENWVVPASSGARRFTVFDCGDEHAQDTKYFKALVNQLNNGGREALLYYLMNEVDVSKFDERKPLITEALSEQQAQSTRGVENLWFECLVRGELPFSDYSRNFMRAETILNWARGQSRREWRDLSAEKLGHLLGNNPRGVHKGLNLTRTKLNNRNGWVIPSLRECRERWNSLRFRFDWEGIDSEWEPTI